MTIVLKSHQSKIRNYKAVNSFQKDNNGLGPLTFSLSENELLYHRVILAKQTASIPRIKDKTHITLNSAVTLRLVVTYRG